MIHFSPEGLPLVNSQRFVQSDYDQHYFVGLFHSLGTDPLCFPAAVSRRQSCSKLPPPEALLIPIRHLQVPVGRRSSEQRLNQHLKNSESWAVASLC